MTTRNVITEDQDIKMLRSMIMISITGVMAIMIIQQLMQPPAAQATTTQPYGSWWLGPNGLILNAELNEFAFPVYVGEAYPGTLDDQPGWRIYKYEFVIIDGDPEPIKIRYADGTTDFDKVWDIRSEYEYS